MVRRLITLERSLQHVAAFPNQFLLPRSERPVQRKKELDESGWKIALSLETVRGAVYWVDLNSTVRAGYCGWCHILGSLFSLIPAVQYVEQQFIILADRTMAVGCGQEHCSIYGTYIHFVGRLRFLLP